MLPVLHEIIQTTSRDLMKVNNSNQWGQIVGEL